MDATAAMMGVSLFMQSAYPPARARLKEIARAGRKETARGQVGSGAGALGQRAEHARETGEPVHSTGARSRLGDGLFIQGLGEVRIPCRREILK